jgi:hypothetical protein
MARRYGAETTVIALMAAIPTSKQANMGSHRIPEGHPNGAVGAGHPLPDKQGRQRLG